MSFKFLEILYRSFKNAKSIVECTAIYQKCKTQSETKEGGEPHDTIAFKFNPLQCAMNNFPHTPHRHYISLYFDTYCYGFKTHICIPMGIEGEYVHFPFRPLPERR